MKNYSGKDCCNNKVRRKVEDSHGETVKYHHRVRNERREHLKKRDVRRKSGKQK